MIDFFGRCEHQRSLNPKGFRSKRLQLFTKDDGVRPTRLHEFHLLRGEGAGHIHQFVTIFAVQLFVFGVDLQHGARRNRILFLKDSITIVV